MSTFWSSNSLEPKRAFRWVGYINLFTNGGDLGPAPFLVKSFTKPVFQMDSEKLINNFTSENEIITKNYVWNDITIVLHDIEPTATGKDQNTSKAVFNWLKSMGYEALQNVQNLSRLFTNLYDNKFSITLEHINANGEPFERWSFHKPQPTKIDFGGELNYETDDTMTVTIDVTYVSADYETIPLTKTSLQQRIAIDVDPFGNIA